MSTLFSAPTGLCPKAQPQAILTLCSTEFVALNADKCELAVIETDIKRLEDDIMKMLREVTA